MWQTQARGHWEVRGYFVGLPIWHISLQMDIRTACIRNEPIFTSCSLVSRVLMISTLRIF
jgi:hypothetical protein